MLVAQTFPIDLPIPLYSDLTIRWFPVRYRVKLVVQSRSLINTRSIARGLALIHVTSEHQAGAPCG